MTSQDVEFLQIYLLAYPVLVFCVALGVYRLTDWMDRREDRRRHAAE